MTGYEVDPTLLNQAARGINDAIGELKTLGIVEQAEAGRGFGSLELRGLQAGHPGLKDTFGQFCERWGWGVRTLVQDGNEIAARLDLAAGIYHDMELYGVGLLKDAASAVAGDPHATSEQVEQQSWSQLATGDLPDYSARSWQRTGQQAGETWLAVGKDLIDGPLPQPTEQP